MANPAESEVQNLLPVQAYFDAQNNFVTFIGQNKPFYATPDPDQSGLHITNSTIDSSVIGGITPAAAHFTTATVSTQPVGATDVVNLLALQSYAAGISWKQPCVAATLANITLSGLQDIDGHTVVAGDRVLVKNQGTASQNGIYLASASTWTRALDADTWDELICAISFVEYGTQAGGAWFCTAQAGGTINVTAVNWSQFTTSATYSAGTGLTLTGSVFSITPVGTAGTYGSASSVPVLTTNASGQVSSVTNTSIAINGNQITSGTIGSSYLSGSYSGITGLGTLLDLTVTNPIVGSITGNAATASNLSGGATGSLPYQTAVNTTGFLAASTDGYILSLVSGVPAWIPNTVGTVTAVTASAPLASSGGSTPNITITQAGTASNGYLSSTDWNTFNGKAGAGANSDITSMTGLTGGISSPDYIQFDTGATVTRATGRLWWDSSDGIQTLNLGMAGSNATLQIGEETYFRIKCASAITEGQVVMFAGTVGASGGLIGAPATGLTADTASYVMGVATESGATNDWIYVTNFGLVRGIDTTGGAEAWVDGQILYYNPAVAGGLTKTLPSAPNAKVQICAVIYADASNGSLFVRPSFGGALGQYEGDVQVTTPANGDLLIRNQTSGKWVNAPLTAGTGISITNAAGGVTVASTVTAGLTVTDDTTTNAARYLTFTSATSGTITAENVSSTKLQYNPSTGTLSSTAFVGDGSGLTGVGGFPSGTLMLFQQTSAPTGWTKQTTHDNKALRVVSGTASSGGTSSFTTVFTNQTPTITTSGLSAAATTLSASQIPSHTHTTSNVSTTGAQFSTYSPLEPNVFGNGSRTSDGGTGGGGSHTHSISGSATSSAITLAVQYVDLIIASKN